MPQFLTDPSIVSWARTTDREKLDSFNHVICSHAIRNKNETLAFRLRLSLIVRSRAAEHPDGFPNWLYRRIHRQLKAVLGKEPSFAVMVELDARGTPYSHGILSCPISRKEAVRNALKTAGGLLETHQGSQHQLRLEQFRSDAGLTNYSLKGASKARWLFGVKSVLLAPNHVRRSAKKNWERER